MSRKILKKGLKNASFLGLSGIFSQILQFFAMVIVVRQFSQEEYASWITIGAFVSLFSVFTFSELEKPIIRESSKQLSKMSSVLEQMIAFQMLCSLLAIFLCIFASFLTDYNSQIRIYIIIFSSTLILDSFRIFSGTIYHSNEEFKLLSKINVVNDIIRTLAIITIVISGFGLLGLVATFIASRTLQTSLTFIFSRNIVAFNPFSKIQLNFDLIYQGFNFLILRFMVRMTNRVNLLMVTFLANPIDVALFGLAFKISELVLFIRNINTNAFLPIMVKNQGNSNFSKKNLVLYSCSILILFFIALIILSPFISTIVTHVFGENYESSGNLIILLLVGQAFIFAFVPITTFLQSTYDEMKLVYPYFITAPSNILLNLYFFDIYGITGIAYSTIIISMFLFIYMIVLTLRLRPSLKSVTNL